MAPIVLTLLQAGFLVLLYLFVYRAVRTIVRDVRPAPAATAPAARAAASAGTDRARAKRTKGGRGKPGEATPRELVVHVPDGRPRVIRLDSSAVTFGRAEVSTVMLVDSYVSERHARVYPRDGQWLLEDAGSTNGTYLNRARVERPTPLSAGDQIGIGKTVVEVRR